MAVKDRNPSSPRAVTGRPRHDVAACSASARLLHSRGGVVAAQSGQRPAQRAPDGRAVDALDPEAGQVAAGDHHPGQAAATSTPVMPRDDQLITAIAPLGRQHPHLRPGREMPDAPAQFQAAFALCGLLSDVRDHAEAARLYLVFTHGPILSAAWRPGNRQPAAPRRIRFSPHPDGRNPVPFRAQD
jgi:hypothetical protein